MQQAEIAALRETDRRRQAQMVETLCVMRDMRREMGDMQTELLALRGQRRARQPAQIKDSRITRLHQGMRTDTSGTEGVVGLTRWIEKMESVFNISGCAIENQVKFATCTLLGAALTWWNGQIRTLGPEAYAMTWEVLKKKMTDKYCPQGEIKKLEIELWNLKVKGNDFTYTERFQELTLICTKFVANETKKVDKYINGLPDNIYGNVKSARPKTLDGFIPETTNGHQQQPFKEANVVKVYNMGTGEKKPYGGSLPKSTGNTNIANTQKGNGAAPKGNGCFEFGNAEKRGNASGNPDSNVVTGTFLLNNHYASILFDTGADRSFISTAFSSLIDIVPTPLDNSYDVELADGKIVGIDTIIRVPMGNEPLTFVANESSTKRISVCSYPHIQKAQEYKWRKDPGPFLAHIFAKKTERHVGRKNKFRTTIVRDVPEVFPVDLARSSSRLRPVGILDRSLIPGAAPLNLEQLSIWLIIFH
ncbi:putative reverse transcriptase domain-containing protein [Tanacetum coccineum]